MLEVQCSDHLEKVREFAKRTHLKEHFERQIDYLSDFTGDGRCKCILGKDFAPYSFTFLLMIKSNGEWKPWINGGLIYQGPAVPADGSFPSLTVSLNKEEGWFIHT